MYTPGIEGRDDGRVAGAAGGGALGATAAVCAVGAGPDARFAAGWLPDRTGAAGAAVEVRREDGAAVAGRFGRLLAADGGAPPRVVEATARAAEPERAGRFIEVSKARRAGCATISGLLASITGRTKRELRGI
ncbi:MAG: hypothetical protein ABSF69_06060 [Polyangiaceae bacterium]|jgi:hypothetical protein